MDRRYSETRGASDGAKQRSDRLVRSYLGRAKAQSRSVNAYGGSTGGASSAGSGAQVSYERGQDLARAREVSRTYGAEALSRGFGARSSAAEARGFKEPRAQEPKPAALGVATPIDDPWAS